jgi:epoxyqueuosine reductase QueG
VNSRDIVEAALRAAGIEAFGILGEDALASACSGLGPEARSRYGLDSARSALVAALPYGEGPRGGPAWASAWGAEHPGPLAAIGRFARANWYAELVARLEAAIASSREGLSLAGIEPGQPKAWRRMANSGLPEKRMALASGLGSLGRHGLVMVPPHGSAVVLGVLLLPIALEDSAPRAAQFSSLCESCGLCAAACPTGALSGSYGLDSGDGRLVGFKRELCLQHWSSVPGELPPAVDAAWGDRLYGCDVCQEACPLFRPDPGASTERGLLGPGLPASWLVSASEEEIRANLKGSALGMAWISPVALKRNAWHLTRGDSLPTMRENGGRDGKH